jgi:hypothetical protein
VDYTRRRTPDKTSFDSDQFFVGIRLDWKFHNARPFVGYFREGQIHDHPTSLTASRSLEETRDGFKQKESADFSTSYVAQKRQYHYWAVGIDFVPLKSFPLVPQVTATLRKLGLQWTRGNETNVPTGLSIGTVPQNLDDLISKGDDKLLNDYFEANPATFSQAVEFAVKTGTLPARRVQGDVDGEIAWKPRDKTYTGTLAIRYRHYTSADLVSSFQLAREFKFEAGLGIPLWWRLKLAPAYTYERARIKADVNNVFRYSKWDIKVSLPIVLRYGLGRLIR